MPGSAKTPPKPGPECVGADHLLVAPRVRAPILRASDATRAPSVVPSAAATSTVWGVPGFAPGNADGSWDAKPGDSRAGSVMSYPMTAVTERADMGAADAVARLAKLEASLAEERQRRQATEQKIQALKRTHRSMSTSSRGAQR